MTLVRILVLAVLGALSGCASQPTIQRDASTAFTGEPDQYVVITVHNRDPVIARAGSTSRDYDFASKYGVSPAARKQLRALASAHRLREMDGWPIAALGVYCAVFQLPADVEPRDALRQLERDRRVESVQPLNSFDTLSTSNDAYRGLQRNLDTMQIEQAHGWSRGERVRIAVIDTGIDTSHPELAGRVVIQKNLVQADAATPAEQHGTAVAGVIAAIDNNREGIAGIAPAASLIGLRACWSKGSDSSACNTFTLAKALAAAVDAESDIVNLSLAGPADALLQRIVAHGSKRGIIYVGALPEGRIGFPCNIPSVICVGVAGQPNATPHLFAPGNEILTLLPAGRYDFLSGSSMAAASVSGSVALLRAREPQLSADAARQLLSPTSRSASDDAASINACDALARLLTKPECAKVTQ